MEKEIVFNPLHSEQLQYTSKVTTGTVATAASTAAKEVTIAGYTPAAGDVLAITYTLGDTSSSTTTLSINGSAPISIKLGSTAASTTTHSIGAGGTVMYYYNGTNLQLFGSMRTSDSDTMQAVYHNVNKVAGVDITRYKIVMEGSDNKFYPLSVGDTTSLTKVQSAMTFKPLGLILWYGTTATVDADATFTYTFTEHTFSTATYTFNKTTSYTNYAPIFIVGTIDANGFFVLDQTDATSWFTQTLPSTEDGKVYIRIGLLYNTTGAIHLETNHPIYEYKNGRVREMANYVLPTASATVLGGVKVGDNLTITDSVLSADADPDDFLKLDQSPAQTVSGGRPSFEGGIQVPSSVGATYSVDLSPIHYNDLDYYITEDASVIFYFSPTEDFQIVMDSGSPSPIAIVGMTDSQPTIYMYLMTALGGANITCYSDLTEANFLTWFKAIAEDPDAVIDYTETAFTFADGVYTNVTTKPVCDPSTNSVWTDPMTVGLYGGLIVGENITSTTNFTNNNIESIFKTRGQIKVGDGALLDLVAAPLVVNQTYRDFSSGALKFAMTFVPQIGSLTGTEETPTYASIYIAGMYGTTIIDGAYARLNGVALGGWCAVQNALSEGGDVTLTEATAMRAGMTYSSETDEDLFIGNFSCFQTDFTNLNQGSSSHNNIYHFEARLLSSNVESVTNNYAFYAIDNSAKATNSWGLYSLEPANYAKKLYLGATPTKPTEDLEVQGNIKAGGYKSSDGSSGLTTTQTFKDGDGNTKTMTIKNGLITDIS